MEKVDVIVDGIHMKVSKGMADIFKRMGEAQAEKQRRWIEAMQDILSKEKPDRT